MRVLVMGAGVVGVTAAWQLLEDGHEVTVLDRRDEAAAETSFANAGLVAPGHAFAWASSRAAGTLLKSLSRKDQPLRFRLRAEPAFWRWSLQFLAQCTSERARRNTKIKHRLCRYSQAALQDVVARTGIAYDGMRKGVLYVHRSQASLDRGAADMQILKEAGQELEVVDRERAAPTTRRPRAASTRTISAPTSASAIACARPRSPSSRATTRATRPTCRSRV
jgi:D-amino-acid dehydrogenase